MTPVLSDLRPIDRPTSCAVLATLDIRLSKQRAAEAVHSGPEPPAVYAIAVAEQVAGGCVEREGLHDLPGSPLAGGIRGHVKVQNLASMMGEDQEDEQHLEANGRGSEQIVRYQVLDVVIQERSPGR